MAVAAGEVAELKKSQLLSKPTVNQSSSPEFNVQSALEAGEIGVLDWDLTNDRMCWSEQMFHNIGLDLMGAGIFISDF